MHGLARTSALIIAVLSGCGDEASETFGTPDPCSERTVDAATRVAQLAGATRTLELDVLHWTASRCGDFVGARDRTGAFSVIDLRGASPGVVELPETDGIRTAAFAEDAGVVWLGTADGRVVRATLPDVAIVADAIVAAEAIEGVSVSSDGEVVGWATAAQAGVLDQLDAQATGADLDGACARPAVFVSASGRSAVLSDCTGSGRRLNFWDLPSGRMESPGALHGTASGLQFAPAIDSVYYASREPREIRRRELSSGTDRSFLSEVRGGQFVHLGLSADHRWLIEGDFEDGGLRAYAVGSSAAPIEHGSACTTLLGFDQAHNTMLCRPPMADVNARAVDDSDVSARIVALDGRRASAAIANEGFLVAEVEDEAGGAFSRLIISTIP